MESSAPEVSVVIPAYNYGRYLREAIDSVLAQEFRNFELIVVDDGSTDNTAEIVASYTDPRVRYIHQTNAGLSAARNTGIRQARAPLIGLLDADDLWKPEMLAQVTQRFQTAEPEVGLIACASERVDSVGQPLGGKTMTHGKERRFTAADIVLQSRFMPSTVVARREAYAACGEFDTTLRSSEDRDMWIRIGSRFRMIHLGTPLVQIRKHPTNMSKHADRMRLNMRKAIGKAYRDRVMPPWHLPFWLRVYSIFYFQNAWMRFDEGRFAGAVWDGACALALWPWFPDHRELNEPSFFRIRGLARFVLMALRSLLPASPKAQPIS
jgi:glycosyltransferase involved in cell wall biosynthesis